MITQFKIFESKELEIGDYVIMGTNNHYLIDFIFNNIGQIVKQRNIEITVKYENVPPEVNKILAYGGDKLNERTFSIYLLLHHSKNKEDLEEILAAKKYNL